MVMRVIEVSAGLLRGELVGVFTAGWNWLLDDFRNAIHLIWQDEPVPMDCCGFGQIVPDMNAHPVSFSNANARSRNLAVKAISLDPHVRQDVPANDGSFQLDYFHSIFDSRGQFPVALRRARGSVSDE